MSKHGGEITVGNKGVIILLLRRMVSTSIHRGDAIES